MYAECWSLTGDPIWREKEWLNILNPSLIEAQVTLTFIQYRTGAVTKYRTKIGAERLLALNLLSLPPEICHEKSAYSVVIESPAPVVPMQVRRFSHLGNPSPRGMCGVIPFPIGDQQVDL